MASQSCELRSDCLVVHFLLASNSRISYKARFRYSALCSSILRQCRQHLQPCTSHHIHPPRRAFFYMPYTSHSTWSITAIPVLGLCSGHSLSMLVWHIPSHNNHTHSLTPCLCCVCEDNKSTCNLMLPLRWVVVGSVDRSRLHSRVRVTIIIWMPPRRL